MNQIKELLMKKQETLKAKLNESSAIKHPTGMEIVLKMDGKVF